MIKTWLPALLVATFTFLYTGCDKEAEIPPEIEFITGAGYTASDTAVAPGTSLTVGISVKKTEDDLKKYNVSVAYDGASSTNTVQDYIIPAAAESHYEKDVTFSVRNMAGSEKYFFTITDSDGNIAQLSLTATVQ